MKQFKYANGCEVELRDAHAVEIKDGNETHHFDEKDKPLYDYGTGETVIEYSGLATDGNTARSWAIAKYSPHSNAPLHYHQDRTEDYYMVEGCVTVRVNGERRSIFAGEHMQIKPGLHHQVVNESDQPAVLLVKAMPSWTKSDYHVLSYAPKTDEESSEGRVPLLKL